MRHYPPSRFPNFGPSPRRNAFTGQGMIAGSIATGSMFTVWNRAAHQQDPFKKYAYLALGSAAVGIAQEVFRHGMNGRSR